MLDLADGDVIKKNMSKLVTGQNKVGSLVEKNLHGYKIIQTKQHFDNLNRKG